MNLVSHITSADIKETFESKYNTEVFGRVAVRAVLLNEKNQVALMHISKFHAYKLPGGGVDDEENLEKAFKREVLEETGYSCEIEGELGFVVEERAPREDLTHVDLKGMIQISFCYLAKAIQFVGVELTDEEAEKGFELVWVDSIDEAIQLIKMSYKDIEDAKFMSLRDEAILQKANAILPKI